MLIQFQYPLVVLELLTHISWETSLSTIEHVELLDLQTPVISNVFLGQHPNSSLSSLRLFHKSVIYLDSFVTF